MTTRDRLKAVIGQWIADQKSRGAKIALDLSDERVLASISRLARLDPRGWERYGDENPQKTVREINELARRLKSVSSYLKGGHLSEHAVLALIRSSPASSSSCDPADLLVEVQWYERRAEEALKSVEINPGRPIKHRAKAVTWQTAHLFRLLTGRKPTTTYSNVSLTRYGPFVDLLEVVFDTLDVEASPRSMAADFIPRMRKSSSSA